MNNNSHTFLFIDATVKDYQYLTPGVKTGTEIFILHPEVDGVKQITNTLSQYQHVETIHIVSHGAPGTIYLGDTQLNRHTLKDYVSEIETWFSSTSDYQTPTLYLYGCDVATTDVGSEFLEKIHQLTKATVYASSTPVGNSNLGGNWDLDICYGAKTLDFPALVFQPQVLATYAGILAVSSGNDGKYTYYDSTDSSGKGTVTFNDIKGTTGAQKVTFSASFNGITAVPTTDFFSFNFYGENFTQINIAENGALIFGNISDTTFTFNNSTLPSTNSNAIFPFWDDLGGGEVYYKKDGDRFIVQWSNFADADDVGSITFQVILYQNSNNIEFVYQDALFDNLSSDYGKSATIGLNKSSSSSLTYSYNQASLNGVTSIRFVTEPRLVTNNLAVTEGETIVLTANNFNATDIDNTDLSKIKYTITNTTSLNGEFQLNNSSAIEFTQQDINDGKVKFVHNGGEDAPSFSITVSDGVNSTNAQVANIQFTKVNDIPTLTGFVNSVSFAENSLNADAAIINSSVTLNDVDSSDFNSGNLTVIYSSGGGQPEDQLSIRNTTSINFSNGIVSFNGNAIGTVDSSTNGSNGKSLVINFNSANATLAAVKALIENLTYQNTSHTPSASRTISVTVNDGDGGTSIPATTTINITAENDAPVNNILGTQPIAVNEDETLTFSGNNLISISDPDAGDNSIKVKLEATNGTLSLNGITGLDFTGGAGDGTDDSTLEFQGTLANINQALNGMTFKPSSNYNGSASVKITTDDLGNSGTGNSLIDTDTINITVNAVNDAPVNTVPTQQTVDEDTDLVFNTANNNLISISDVDINNTTYPVTVTLAVSNGVLTLSSTTGLTFEDNTSNGKGTITVTGKLADINTALDGLTYRGLLNYNGEDTLTITTNDLGNIGIGGYLPDTDTVKIQINAVNDAPVNTVPTQQSVDEDTDLIFSTANNNLISISDVDINNTTYPVTVTLAVSNGVLTLSSTTGLTFANNTSNGEGTITVTGKLADINSALNGLTYRGLLNYNGEDTLTITTNDLGNIGIGGYLPDTDTVKIQINAVNDAPLNTVPSQQTVDEDTDLVFNTANNNLISISDVDIDNTTDSVTVTLAVSNGVLTLSSTTGLTFEDNTSNGEGTITVTGKLADINTALDGLTYRGLLNYNGEDTLTITTNDNGNIGKVSALADTDTVKIQIIAVNDEPENSVPSQQSVDEDTDLIFNTANNNLISIGDVDIDNTTDSVTVTLAVNNGVLTLSSTTGLTFEDNTSNGEGTITVTGKLADINTALDGLTYRGLLNYNGEDTLTITSNDNGNIGKVSALEDSDTVKIQINAVNDAPINSVPSQQTVDEDTDLIFNTANNNLISIGDVDIDETRDSVTVTLAVNNGVLTLSSTTGLTFEDNTSNGEGTITVTGKLADINTALDGLTYRASENYNGEDTLTITTNDNGNIGKVSELEDSDTVKIQINAVNDAPVNTVPSQQTVDEDTDLVFNTANNNLISISDVDIDNTTDSVTVTLAVNNGVLTLSSTTGLTFEDNTSNGKATITVTGKLADINTALDGLTYRASENYNGEDTLTITTNDNGNIGKVSELEDSDTVKIQINPVNDPPFHALVPEVQSVKEDTDLVFNVANKNAISISDVDVDGDQEPIVGELQVTLAVNHGKVTLGTTTDLNFDPDKGNDSATIIFTGSLENINAALAGLIYRADENFNGEDSLTITVNDQSNGGIGGDKIDQNIIKINVQAVNDKPINTIPSNQTVDEDRDLVFSNSNSNAITISDVDFNEAVDEAEVQLSVSHGLLSLQETVGLTVTQGDTNGSATITLTGKLADINSALDGLTYQGNANFQGEDTLTIKTSDLGNRGNGEVLIDESTIDITVNPVNDAPVNTIPQQQQVDQYEKLIFSAEQGNVISVSDVDIDPEKDKVEVTVAVSKGTLTLAQLQGLNFIEGKGTADAKMTFNGKLVDVNKALNGMFYLGNKDFSGADTLTITTSDLGNFGADSILYDQDTIDIKVIPDLDKDGISNLIEKKVASEIAKQEFADVYLKNLSQRSINEAGIIALFAGDNGTKQPTVIAIEDQDQKQLGGNPQNPVLVIRNLDTKRLEDVVKDVILAFDNKDVKKSSLNKVTPKLNVINFEVLPDSILTNPDLQQKVVDSIQKKPIRLEINLPDSPENEAINTILLRKADGTLVDFRRQLNPQRGQLDEDLLTGVVLQDRNLDGKADWAVVYLQDGQWGDTDGLSNGKIEQSLVAVNWDLGAKRMEFGSNQGRLNFQGNRSHVQFTLDRYSGVDASEIGMARVRFGDNGQIIEVNGQAVNSVDEAKQLIIQRGETVFSSLTNRNNPNFGTQTHTAVFEAGEEAVFYLIQGGSKDELLFNGVNSKPIQFSLPSLNGGKAVFQASGDDSKQTAKISFAGLFDISAKILTSEEIRSQVALLAISQSQTLGNKPGELIDLKSAGAFDNKQVKLKFSIQREASQSNSAYFYRVDDTKGSIRDPLTGLLLDPTTQLNEQQKQRYLELATGDRLVQNAQFETNNFITNEITITVNGGQYYAPFLVSNGTLSTIGKDYSRILSSYMNMNSDRVDHIRNLGNNMFGIEDVIGGGDRDYNDMILSIKQVQVFS